MAKNDVQNRCLVFEQISAPFWTIFGAKMGAKMDPKIALKSTSAPQGRPEASGEPFGSHFGAILDLFSTKFGLLLELSGYKPSTKQSKTLFEITRQKVFRNHCRPEAQKAMARWPAWGAHAPTGDPATELPSSGQAVSEAIFGVQNQKI